jgi:hypothetical protein
MIAACRRAGQRSRQSVNHNAARMQTRPRGTFENGGSEMEKQLAIAKARRVAQEEKTVRFVVYDPTMDYVPADCRFYTCSAGELEFYYHAKPEEIVFCSED